MATIPPPGPYEAIRLALYGAGDDVLSMEDMVRVETVARALEESERACVGVDGTREYRLQAAHLVRLLRGGA